MVSCLMISRRLVVGNDKVRASNDMTGERLHGTASGSSAERQLCSSDMSIPKSRDTQRHYQGELDGTVTE
jgi:hypothetical protein